MASQRKLIAGNWKMNGNLASISECVTMIGGSKAMNIGVELLICPPVTLIHSFAATSRGSFLKIGAQDCHPASSGAHTGDVSAEMLADLGATHVIIGHSERRTDHRETDAIVLAKAVAVARAGLIAIICVGETEAEREAGETLAIIERQLAGSIPASAKAKGVIIAYEPVWAIGTGKTPSIQDVKTVHATIRAKLSERFGAEGQAMRLLYGGSVKPANAAELLRIANVDGALVGGASLKAEDFLAIAKAC